MTRWRAAIPLVVLLAGCTPSPPAANHAGSGARTETPAAATGPYGVLVDLLSQPSAYNVSVIAADGTVVAKETATKRTPVVNASGHGLELPYVSTSLTTLYYLDGNHDIYALPMSDLASKPRLVYTIAAGPGVAAAFAVSPDDQQIAVSVISYEAAPPYLQLYTDNLGGVNAHVIFQSHSDYVWPVAWHGGNLVLAHAYGAYVEEALKAAPAQDNPYWAISYHVVDPKTANRVVLMGACTVSGPVSPAGSACIQGGTIDWQGNTTDWSTRDWGSISAAGSISPDGTMVAAADPDHPERLDFWRPGGSIATWVSGAAASDWPGWLDNAHVVISSATIAGYMPRIITLSPGQTLISYTNALGFYAARLPADVT